MGDISAIIAAKTDQLNAADLAGKSITVTFGEIMLKGGQEQPVEIRLVGNDKFYRPGKSMCRVMAKAWGNETALWKGKSATLYCDPKIKFGPLEVGGIRISHLSHIDGPMTVALQMSKGVKKGFTVKPLVAEVRQIANTEQVAQADPAQKWAAAYIANINAFETIEELDAFAGTKAAKIEEMKVKRPELYDQCGQALERKRDALDDPFANPNEGTGETATSLDEWLTRIAAAADIDTLGLAVDAARADHGEEERIYAARDRWVADRKGSKS